MVQKIFDTDNEEDMALLWSILPDDIEKICVEDSGYTQFHYKKVGPCEHSVSSLNLIQINFHDSTEITRPIPEATEADIGKWCCFWDNCSEDVMIGKLSVIVRDGGRPSYRLGGYAVFEHARRLTKREIEELC